MATSDLLLAIYVNPDGGDWEITPDGDLVTVVNSASIGQSAFLRIKQPLPDFIFDTTFGSMIFEFLKFPNTESVRQLCLELLRDALAAEVALGRIKTVQDVHIDGFEGTEVKLSVTIVDSFDTITILGAS